MVRRRSTFYASVAACFAFLSISAVSEADYTTKVVPTTNWGTWEGWGASLCWWANVFGTRDDLADIFFTRNTVTFAGQALPGLGFNIVRYNAGACSWNSIGGTTMVASPNIAAFRQMPGFWLDWNSTDPASSSWDWTVDANQRAMLLKAKARGANLFELFSNSPMWWMCANHNPSGAASATTDNLQSWNNTSHAIYLANVAKKAKDSWGITFTSVEPFNEPVTNYWSATGTQEGCHFSPGLQATIIPLLRTELNNRGLTSTAVAASDETSYDQGTSTWNSFTSTVKGQVGRVNVHGYQYGSGRRDLLYTAVAGKKLWNTEYGESDGTGMSLAANLNLDLRWLHPTAWNYWQPLDSGGWGLIASNPGDNWIGSANVKYFVMAQFCRHIRPGMTILDGGEGNTVAAYDSTNHKLVLVTTNYGTAQNITYDLTNYGTVSGSVSRWQTVTGGTDRYAASSGPAISAKKFTIAVPANTVVTLEVTGVS